MLDSAVSLRTYDHLNARLWREDSTRTDHYHQSILLHIRGGEQYLNTSRRISVEKVYRIESRISE